MRTSLFIFFFALVFNSLNVLAHEEPPKTLNEKKEKKKAMEKILKSKIKKIIVWDYKIKGDQVITDKNKVFVQEYDNNGRMTKIEAYKNDTFNLRMEYVFDNEGNMIADSDFSANNKMLERNTYKFDNEGRVISGESYNESGNQKGRFNYTASHDKHQISFIKYKENDSLEYKIKYNYQNNFDHSDYTEAIKYDSANNILLKVTKTYNQKGNVVEKAIFGPDLKEMHRFIYEYDVSDNLTKISKWKKDGTLEWVDCYKFDRNGNISEKKSYSPLGTLKLCYVYELIIF